MSHIFLLHTLSAEKGKIIHRVMQLC